MSLNHGGAHLNQQRECLAREQPKVNHEALDRSSVLPILSVLLVLLPDPFSGRSCLSGLPESPQLLGSAFREGKGMLCRRQTWRGDTVVPRARSTHSHFCRVHSQSTWRRGSRSRETILARATHHPGTTPVPPLSGCHMLCQVIIPGVSRPPSLSACVAPKTCGLMLVWPLLSVFLIVKAIAS